MFLLMLGEGFPVSKMAEKKESVRILVALAICGVFMSVCKAEQCGSQANWAKCAGSLCCSKWGWCGSSDQYCGQGCQSGRCTSGGGSSGGGSGSGAGGGGGAGGSVGSLISDSAFRQFLSQSTSGACPANGFYTRSAFLTAAAAFQGFGTSGDVTMKKRELAAFFANIAHESGSGCYKEEIAKGLYCDQNSAPCAPNQQYYGRGPMQISWNYNYRMAGNALGFDGINNPSIVASDPIISFKTAVWYWMTQHSPTCHTAIIQGQGFGATIKAINGGIECGPNAAQAQQQARINLYRSFCSILGVDPGNGLTC